MLRRDVLFSTIAAGAGAIATPRGLPASTAGERRGRARIQTRDGVSLFYRDWGSGRPVLFVHSLSLSSAMWSYQEAFLGDHGVRCVSFDRRGHGRSDEAAPGLDLDTYADDLEAVIDGLALRDVVLAGHSVGCGEIIRYIARHGTNRVAKVVMLAPTTPFVLQTADNPYGAPAAYFEQMRAAWAADYPKWLQDNRSPFFAADTSPQMMDWVQTELLKAHVPTAIAYNRTYVRTDLRADLTRIDRPVLILHGDKDVSAPLDITGRRTALGIPGAVLNVYTGAAHGLFVTHLNQVNRDILEFVNS
jgi:non-heme chloroperoxidase